MKDTKKNFIMKRIGIAAAATILGGGGSLTIAILQYYITKDTTTLVVNKVHDLIVELDDAFDL